VVPIDINTRISCRDNLYNTLVQEAEKNIADPTQMNHTIHALEVGRLTDPTSIPKLGESQLAVVALIGECRKIDSAYESIDFELLSNKGPTDTDPRGGGANQPEAILYPWIPGPWHDLPVVTCR